MLHELKMNKKWYKVLLMAIIKEFSFKRLPVITADSFDSCTYSFASG